MAEERGSLSPISTVPRHVAIIMDGNGRWARRRGLPRFAGHKAGLETVRTTIKGCIHHGVKVLTLFAFSSENWRRPPEEVSLLMNLFMTALDREVRKLHSNGVRLRVIGDRQAFGEKLQAKIAAAEALTSANTALELVIAANYGGRWDLTEAARRVAERVQAGELPPSSITEETLTAELSLAGLPEPDLFIRTGGEKRISNFLLWNLAYTELYFTPLLWPEFGSEDFAAALKDFTTRQRRFGRTGEQVEQNRGA